MAIDEAVPWLVTTAEDVSGLRAVHISQSGLARVAMASISGRMPAVGVAVDDIASGSQVNIQTGGLFILTSGLVDYSGYISQPVYVGRSGNIVTASGSWNSGGFLSGDIIQLMGSVFNSGGVLINTVFPISSGGQFLGSGVVVSGNIGNNAVNSGNLASGSVGKFHLSSGAVQSGHIGDNAVNSGNLSSGSVGKFHHASGSVLSGHLGDGSVVSGSIASGQVSTSHIASGQVQNVNLASGSVSSGQTASGATVTYAAALVDTSFTAAEAISGFKPCAAESGGGLVVAMASSGLRMPAVGVSMTNVASGGTVNLLTWGKLVLTSGFADLWSGRQLGVSGNVGQGLWVSPSGHVIMAGRPIASVFAQRIGWGLSGAVYVQPGPLLISGGGFSGII